MRATVEVTTEPFRGEGRQPPAHVRAVLQAALDAALQADPGPFGTVASGEQDAVLAAVPLLVRAAVDAGATRVTMQLSVGAQHITTAAAPGGPAGPAGPAGAAAPPPAGDLLEGLVTQVEAELGRPLAELDRAGKQHAVRLLEERGAFTLRRSAESVAARLGVSRFTVYNYLNRERSGR